MGLFFRRLGNFFASGGIRVFLRQCSDFFTEDRGRWFLREWRERPHVVVAVLVFLVVILWLFLGSRDSVIVAGDHQVTLGSGDDFGGVGGVNIIDKVRVFESRRILYRPLLQLAGDTESNREVVLRSQISGWVSSILSGRGSFVASGDVLVEFHEEAFSATLLSAERRVEHARKEHEAAIELNKEGFEAELSVLRLSASLAEAEADLARAERDIEHLRIVSPFAGVVIDQSVEEGDFLQVGAAALTVAELHPLILNVELSENNYHAVEVGQRVEAELLGGDIVSAEISYIKASASDETRTFVVQAKIDNSLYRHPVGASAIMRLRLPAIEVHRVHSSYLSLSDDGELGIKVYADGLVEFVSVEIIGDSDGLLQVSGALPDDVMIIGDGQGFVSDGQRVIAEMFIPDWL